MKNYALLQFVGSESFWRRIFHKEEYYCYPIVYEDGFTSYHKNVAQEHGSPRGYICKGYILSLYPTEEMLPSEARKYCEERVFAGRPICIPPRAVMKKVLKNIFIINNMIKELGGNPFSNDWYMAQNDKWGDAGGHPNTDIILAVHPQISDKDTCICVGKNTKVAFCPSVKI